MDQSTQSIFLIIFVGLAALAMLIQSVVLLGMFFVARDLRAKILKIWPEVESIVAVSRRTVERVEKQVEKIGTTSSAVLDTTKQQLGKVDELLSDVSTRAKIQMDRAELVLDDSMTRIQQTVAIVQSGVLRPIREVHGILSGIRTAIAYLGRAGRATVDHATSDEEMFI